MVSCLPDMKSMIAVRSDPIAAARFFRVLGDATRLRILELLQEQREMTVGDLVAEVAQTQPRVSTHLACLRHCGFVIAERRGNEVAYPLAIEGLDGILDRAADTMAPITERLATCTRIGPEWV